MTRMPRWSAPAIPELPAIAHAAIAGGYGYLTGLLGRDEDRGTAPRPAGSSARSTRARLRSYWG